MQDGEGEIKAASLYLWTLLVIKRLRVLLSLSPFCWLVCGLGSKLVTVSFRLWS